MIIAQRKEVMIVNKHAGGFSLIEVLIASLLFSIILLSFMQLEKTLFHQRHYITNKLHADQVIFQLLDSYPDIAQHIIPTHWTYLVQNKTYNNQCTLVIITVTIPNYDKSEQQRLFCQ